MRRIENGPLWLEKIEKNMPEVIRRMELSVLVHMTEVSCGCKAPSLHGLDSVGRLNLFRRLTVDAVNNCSKEELPSFRENMYKHAFRIGRCLSFLPGLRKSEMKKRLITVLYRNIGIEVRDAEDGSNEPDSWHICILHCSFSKAYTPGICRVMSGMDAGIICGLFGGGKLKFNRRITEGCPHCRAVYKK